MNISIHPDTIKPRRFDIDTDCGLWKQSTVLCEQITTIPSDALLERLGSVRKQEDIDKINLALKISLGIREVES